MIPSTNHIDNLDESTSSPPRPNIMLLGLLMALSTMANSIVAPMLPIYATKLNATSTQIGLLVSIFGFVRFVIQPIIGNYSDKWGHRRVIQAMLALFTIAGLGYAVGENIQSLLFFRSIQAIAVGGLSVSIRAYINQITTKNNRGGVNGTISAMQNAGSLLGPVVGGVAADWLSIQAPFYLLSFFSLIGLILSFSLPNVKFNQYNIDSNKHNKKQTRWPNTLYLLAGINILEFVGLGIWVTLWPIFASETMHWNSSLIGLSFSVSALASLITAPVWGKISDLYGRTISGITGLLFLLIQPVAVVLFNHNFVLLWLCFVLAGAGGTGYFNAYYTIVGDLSPDGDVGKIQGVLGAASQLGNSAGSILGSFIWQALTIQIAFWTDASILMICIIGYIPLFITEMRTRKQNKTYEEELTQ